MSFASALRRTGTRLLAAVAVATAFCASAPAVERIVVYSGTFDPPHLGHRELVARIQAIFEASRSYVVVNVKSVHKGAITPYELRKRMASANFAGLPNTSISSDEIEAAFREDDMRGVIDRLRARHPDAEILQVMGDDSYRRFLEATEGGKIPGLRIVVVPRHPETKVEIPSGSTATTVVTLEEKGYSSTKARRVLLEGGMPDFLDAEVARLIRDLDIYPVQLPGSAAFCHPLLSPDMF